MQVNWATFTSWRHGDHNICVCETIQQIREVVEDTFDGYEDDERPQMSNFKNWREVEKKLESLKMSDNIWIEWDDTTWMTIQRMTQTDEEMDATLYGAIRRMRERNEREN